MKKTIILTCLIINSIASFAQDENVFPEKDGKIYYSEIITVDSSITKSELFVAARKWFANTYKSANDVIQMQDKEAGEIVGKGIVTALLTIPLNSPEEINAYHTITITVKDGRYKYEITDFYGKYYQTSSAYISGGWQTIPLGNKPEKVDITQYPKMARKMIERQSQSYDKNRIKMHKTVNSKILALIESLKAAMSKAKTSTDNW
jgi:hypothetical protein